MNWRRHQALSVATILILTGSPVLAAPELPQVVEQQPDFSQVAISLDDLPDGFQDVSSSEEGKVGFTTLFQSLFDVNFGPSNRREQGTPNGIQTSLNNSSMFTHIDPPAFFEYLIVASVVMSKEPTTEVLALNKQRERLNEWFQELSSAQTPGAAITWDDVREIDNTNNIGEESLGLSARMSMADVPMRAEFILFRKDRVIGFVILAYLQGTPKTVEIGDIARLLESRIPR